MYTYAHVFAHKFQRTREKIFFEFDESRSNRSRSNARQKEKRNEITRGYGVKGVQARSRFKFPTRNIRTRSWVGAVNREGRNGSKICDKRVHVNATRYARRPQICDGPLYPWPGIGMCEVFPSASRSTRILQNKRVCVKFLFRGMGQGR